MLSLVRKSIQRSINNSIKTKLMILFMATATIALLVAFTAFLAFEVFTYMETLQQESATIAQMLAESSAAVIPSGDAVLARSALSGLRAEPRILQACIYDRAGRILATYQHRSAPVDCPLPTGVPVSRFTPYYLLVHHPVMIDGKRAGELFIEVGLTEMYLRLARFGGIGVAALLLASLVAMFLSARWQRLISDPILKLTEVAEMVSANANYSLRAAKGSDDEMGMLIEQFNAMMEQFNHRDCALRDAQDKLEQRVEERTRNLQAEIAERKVIEQDLLNAKVAAETSNHAKSAFLANMSHELRTPLNAIIGYSEMLEEDAQADLNAEAVSDLRRIQSAGRHLLSLVSDILDLSKIEAGKIEINMEIVQVSNIIESVAQTIEPLARKNGNRLVIDKSSWNGTLYADPTKFYQSLLNLLSNACKFTEGGTITLKVEYRHGSDRDWVCWHVQDTGIGIPEEGLKELFQAFSQVDSSATRRHGGTGLGLAISQRLCRLMGGFITVESVPQQGSTFTIHLPAIEAVSDVEAPKAPVVGRVSN